MSAVPPQLETPLLRLYRADAPPVAERSSHFRPDTLPAATCLSEQALKKVLFPYRPEGTISLKLYPRGITLSSVCGRARISAQKGRFFFAPQGFSSGTFGECSAFGQIKKELRAPLSFSFKMPKIRAFYWWRALPFPTRFHCHAGILLNILHQRQLRGNA